MIVTKQAPMFIAPAVMPDNKIVHDYDMRKATGKKGLIIFFWPKDFTYVCPSEIIAFDNKLEEFQKRGFNVLGISTDSDYVHLAWKKIPVEKGGIGNVQFPLISDIKKEITRAYDILYDESIALRGSYLIDSNNIVRHAIVNDLPLGRSIDEMIRMADALLFVEEHGEVCPANWKKGQEGMKPTQEGVENYLSKNAKKL